MLKKFIRERVSELHNVTWPTRRQAVHSMIIVLVIMLLVGLFLGVLDYIFNQGVLFLLNT
ncbi:preprotein translocase subunit SecE [Candidatus Gracilibacteria bacterium]|nr:preprotein translocase subunit SecE [Candidatus Gracilibacteria bacterium]MCF7819453.1 preprotein translocase subunit SecE [Candidatus Gracilibacteria bacterium]